PGDGILLRDEAGRLDGAEEPDGDEDELVPGLGRGAALLRRRAGVRVKEPAGGYGGRPRAVEAGEAGAVPGVVPERVQDGAVRGRAEGGLRPGEGADGAGDSLAHLPGHRRQPPTGAEQE